MPLVEVIYEHGVLRPLQPLDLAEGTLLEVTIPAVPSPRPEQEQVDEAEYLAFLSELERIADLPYTPNPDGRTDISEHHDDFLYPKHGEQP